MPDSGQLGAADTPLRLLSSVHYLTDGELPQLYDYPDDGTWLRANFISSLDGGATVDGTSGAMAGPGDRFVFNLLRELADVIVVGVGTVRIEGYSGVRMGVVQRQHRQARGQSEVPQLAIVTRSGRLDRDMAVFTRTEMAPLVLTTTAFVVARPGTGLDEASVIAYTREHLANFKTPRSVRFVDVLPRNAAGKVSKPQLRELG
ncbi:pyrimidine reductase family protein [Mycobacterium tuberculosis]|nr:pyrimidine reductase family protein [Mycobacterium tuberculosis]